MPFHGFYPLSKHALEVYNDSLRRELSSLGIKVVIIRPGAFKTSMQGGIINQFENLVSQLVAELLIFLFQLPFV